MQDSKKYKVSILDENYSLISDEPEHVVLKSVEFVRSLLQEITEKAPSLNSRQAATLALIKVALTKNKLEEELRSYKQKEEELLKVFEQDSSIAQF